MTPQHLSDEAVAAFADGVLSGTARERARRHCAECAECRTAVAVQREAVLALRAAPAPALPSGLLDRLRAVPVTTPVHTLPTALAPDGSTMLATAAPWRPAIAPVAAFAPSAPAPTVASGWAGRRLRHLAATAAAVAVAGVLAAGSTAHATGRQAGHPRPLEPGPGVSVAPADYAPGFAAVLRR